MPAPRFSAPAVTVPEVATTAASAPAPVTLAPDEETYQPRQSPDPPLDTEPALVAPAPETAPAPEVSTPVVEPNTPITTEPVSTAPCTTPT
jgi:hypothetical protein